MKVTHHTELTMYIYEKLLAHLTCTELSSLCEAHERHPDQLSVALHRPAWSSAALVHAAR